MSEEISISAIHTPCKKCVFAEYEGKTQKACRLNYLDIYKNLTDVIEVFDNDLDFYVINDKKCIGYRENSWFTKFGLENSSIEEKLNKFYELNHIDYFIVINLDSMDSEDIRILTLAEDISKLTIKPQKIIFIRYAKNALVHNYEKIQAFLKTANLNKCPWRIQTMEDNNAVYYNTLHSVINANKFPRFVLSVQLDDNYPLDTIVNLANDIVYKKLDRFYAIANSKKSSLLFSGVLYRFSLVAEHINILDNDENFIFI